MSNDIKLPLERPIEEAIEIYQARFFVFIMVVIINFILLCTLIFSLKIQKQWAIITSWSWIVFILIPLVYFYKREIISSNIIKLYKVSTTLYNFILSIVKDSLTFFLLKTTCLLPIILMSYFLDIITILDSIYISIRGNRKARKK
jgi:hypothetical protein